MVTSKVSFFKLEYNMKKKPFKVWIFIRRFDRNKTHYNDSPTCSGPTYLMG